MDRDGRSLRKIPRIFPIRPFIALNERCMDRYMGRGAKKVSFRLPEIRPWEPILWLPWTEVSMDLGSWSRINFFPLLLKQKEV